MAVIVSGVALLVAVVGVVTGLGTLALYELDVIGADASANLGVASILCSLISIPIGFVGWRWAEKRGQQPLIGQAAALTGAGTFVGWFVLFVYALGKDTP